MSKVYFISDLHIGHKKILQFSGEYRQGTTVDEHDEWIVDQWNSVVKKRDTVWLLGDVCFDKEKLHLLGQLNGQVKLILGNHDKLPVQDYFQHLRYLGGLCSYKGFWLSHCPIHPLEMRKRKGNIHGHMHQHLIPAPEYRYINVCVDQNKGVPITFDEVVSKFEKGEARWK